MYEIVKVPTNPLLGNPTRRVFSFVEPMTIFFFGTYLVNNTNFNSNNQSNTLVTIVDDSKVDSVVSAITDAASTGTKGDGKIFISPIDEAVDIATKAKGST